MNLSLGEFGALVAKAFRGAGYSWGLTEDASFAARRLAEFDRGAGASVVRLLQATSGIETAALMPNPQLERARNILCPVCVGASLVDLGNSQDIAFDRLVEPALLAPFLVLLSTDSQGYSLHWDGGGCEVDSNGLVLTGNCRPDVGSVRVLKQSAGRTAQPERIERVDLDESTAAALHEFAHRTYAPATEESRASGAGAGILDQD